MYQTINKSNLQKITEEVIKSLSHRSKVTSKLRPIGKYLGPKTGVTRI